MDIVNGNVTVLQQGLDSNSKSRKSRLLSCKNILICWIYRAIECRVGWAGLKFCIKLKCSFLPPEAQRSLISLNLRDSRRDKFVMHQVQVVNPGDEWSQDSEDKTSWLTHR